MATVDPAQPIRVLVVDHDPAIYALTARVLRGAGYAVGVASGAAAALRIVQRDGTFNLFVIDAQMPEMGGVDLARKLRERHPDAKVLYCTADANLLFQEERVLWRNEAVLVKPITVTGLREAVSLLLFDHRRGPVLPAQNTPQSRKHEIERMLRGAQRARDDASGAKARARKRKAEVDARFRSLRAAHKWSEP